MSYSVLNAKVDLQGVLHGTTLNQIQNLDGVFDRAARQLLQDMDPQETKRTVEFVRPIFNGVFDYPIAADVKGNKLVDIRPQVRRLPRDIWSQAYNQAFDVAKGNVFSLANMFTMNFNTGVKTIRIDAPFLNAPVALNLAESVDVNGTWQAGGTASGLETNNTNFVIGSGSLQFDATAGAAYVEVSDMASVDLSNVVNQSSLFCWVYVPDGSDLTSVQLRWGSSSGAYYALTVTETQQDVAFANGWNLCQFEWSQASTTGSPDASDITYLRVTLNLTASAAGCLVNGIESVLGTVMEYEYYSKYLFRDASTGAFQERVTDDSNLINLDTDSYNVFFNKLAEFAAQQQQGTDAAGDVAYFRDEYGRGLARYQAMYKSEVQKPQSVYYYQPRKGYGRLGVPWSE